MAFNMAAFYEKCAKAHLAASDQHSELAKCHKRLANKSTSDDDHASIAKCHERLADHHADIANQHERAAKALGTEVDTHDDSRGIDSLKIGRADDLQKFGMLGLRDSDTLMPTKVNAKLVPRPGGPPIDEEEDPTSVVDQWARPEIQKSILGQ